MNETLTRCRNDWLWWRWSISRKEKKWSLKPTVKRRVQPGATASQSAPAKFSPWENGSPKGISAARGLSVVYAAWRTQPSTDDILRQCFIFQYWDAANRTQKRYWGQTWLSTTGKQKICCFDFRLAWFIQPDPAYESSIVNHRIKTCQKKVHRQFLPGRFVVAAE